MTACVPVSGVTDEDPAFDHWDIEVDTSDPPADLAPLVAAVEDPVEGFFGPGTMMWRVGRETALFLGGMTCILLQLSHPKVAPGIEHSDYEADPHARFSRTFEVVDAIIFGDVETALEGAMIVRELHTYVTGELDEDVGPYAAGETYAANDPDLLLWVHATLIHQSVVAYDTYVEDLHDEEAERFYQDSKTFGQLFGVPREQYPETLSEFRTYVDRTAEEKLALGQTGAAVRDIILETSYLPGPALTTVLRPVRAFFGAATMPPAARDALGLEWRRRHEAAFRLFRAAVRPTYRALPARIRFKDAYLEAMGRVAADSDTRATRPTAATPDD
jgi:uncharacterized protein (DUF2236 family)